MRRPICRVRPLPSPTPTSCAAWRVRPRRLPPARSAAGPRRCPPAELLTCELVTNAVQHATDAGWVTVAVMHRGAVVHVDVVDDGRSGLPHWREATGQDEGGRGFQLVNEIAERWGFLRERAGTCVWFELSPADG